MNFYNVARQHVAKAVSTALDCVLPRSCCLCDTLGEVICNRCSVAISKHRLIRCHGCALTKACDCEKPDWAIDRTITLTSYEPPYDRLIGEMKFQSKQSIGHILGKLMGRQFQEIIEKENLNPKYFSLMPIPLSSARFRQRGFNQAHSIADAVRKQVHTVPMSLNTGLTRTADKQSQSTLDRAQRLVNLRNAYALSINFDRTTKPHIILVDDVMTTGATLNTCAALLKRNGVREVWAMVAARTE
jgi:ComF family protein